jgi:hypothetical protein
LSFSILGSPLHGTVTVDAATGQYRYVPSAGYQGDDEFVVSVRDLSGQVTLAIAKVTVGPMTFPWKNTAMPQDVNNDGFITASDAVAVINHLNAFGAGPLARRLAAPPAAFLDVNGDNYVSSIDALTVINYLNSQPAAADVRR